MGVPDMVIKPMQRLQNIYAKLVLGLNKYDSATEALYTLHWLPKGHLYMPSMYPFKCSRIS